MGVFWLTVLVHRGHTDQPEVIIKEPPGQTQVFTGETVTLQCKTEGGDDWGWRYYWYKNGQSVPSGWKSEYTFVVTADHNAGFSCTTWKSGTNSERSAPVRLSVSDQPEVIIKEPPGQTVFTGETVTLQCKTEGGEDQGRSYYWYKNGQPVHSEGKSEYTLKVTADDNATFSCETWKSDTYSKRSARVRLSVSALPIATLSVHPESRLFTGESVTLTCVIKAHGGWTYQWYKSKQGGWTAVSQSGSNTVNTLTIRGGAVISGDQYRCRGGRTGRPTSSQNSDSVTLTVEAERPKPELTSSHKGAAALIGNPVVLYCKLDQSTGWKFYWSKQTQNPENETPSYTISSVSVSDGGQYRCRAGRGDPVYYTNHSDALLIVVTGGVVILESPVHPVPEGDPLTLRCSYRHTKPSNLTAEFYKNGSLLQTQTPGEMTIRTVSKSDEGLYHCKHPERGESPKSWISVRGSSFSVSRLFSSLLAASPYLLVSIILVVKCCRARAKPDELNTLALLSTFEVMGRQQDLKTPPEGSRDQPHSSHQGIPEPHNDQTHV
ncbi:hypothetical protein NFI96_007777, partial [Prochilodus magdalenae]